MSETPISVAVTEQVNAYFQAVYGKDYVYRAPEMFPPMERWMLAIASGNVAWTEKVMDQVVAVQQAVGR